jgi:hypothetical protein
MTFDDYMIDEIAVASFVDDDNVDQIPTYLAPVVVPARIEERRRELRRADGTTITTETDVATRATVVERDRVWTAPFAGHDTPRTFPPGFVFYDADARSPRRLVNARRMAGSGGHVEFSV